MFYYLTTSDNRTNIVSETGRVMYSVPATFGCRLYTTTDGYALTYELQMHILDAQFKLVETVDFRGVIMDVFVFGNYAVVHVHGMTENNLYFMCNNREFKKLSFKSVIRYTVGSHLYVFSDECMFVIKKDLQYRVRKGVNLHYDRILHRYNTRYVHAYMDEEEGYIDTLDGSWNPCNCDEVFEIDGNVALLHISVHGDVRLVTGGQTYIIKYDSDRANILRQSHAFLYMKGSAWCLCDETESPRLIHPRGVTYMWTDYSNLVPIRVHTDYGIAKAKRDDKDCYIVFDHEFNVLREFSNKVIDVVRGVEERVKYHEQCSDIDIICQ